MKQEQSQSMQKAWRATKQSGFSLVEILLSSAVFVLLVTALVGAYLYGQEATMLAGNRARANMLAEEGLEAVRNIRDADFANVTDGTYGLATTTNQWNLSGSSDSAGMFTRNVTISTVDTNRKNVVSTVQWQQNPQRTGSVVLTTYLTYWQKVSALWSQAVSSGSLDLSGNQDGLKIQTLGSYAYMIRANSTNNFVVLNISSPDTPSLVSTISITGTPTNLFVLGNYAYVTSNDNSQELQILDISNPSSPSVVGSYNAPGNSDANGVYVVGTTAYVVQASQANEEFNVVNVSNRASPAQLGVLDLGATGYEVVVSGNYAFVASRSNTQEVQVVNISNPASMSIVGSLNLSSNTDATTIAISGNTLFVGQGTNFRTVDITAPTTPILLGTLVVSGNINDIALDVAANYVFVADQDASAEFQVIDATTLSSPTLAIGLNITGTNPLKGVAYSTTNDRAYAVGTLDTQELTVFAPQ